MGFGDPQKISWNELMTLDLSLTPCNCCFRDDSPAKVEKTCRTPVDPFQLSKRQLIIQACKTTAAYDVYCRFCTSQTRCKTPDPRQTKRAWEREVSFWRQQIREFSP
eukprot:symbB.v1.2.017901.t1/scaffold1407.1/size120637/5